SIVHPVQLRMIQPTIFKTFDVLYNYLNSLFLFFLMDTTTTEIYTLSLHDALPIFTGCGRPRILSCWPGSWTWGSGSRCARASSRSEEHTSELQSRFDVVCRLLLEKKKR